MANRIIDLRDPDYVMPASRYIELSKKAETYHKRSESAKKGWETRRLKNYLKSKEI